MLYSFARVSAVIGMRRQDYFRQERAALLVEPEPPLPCHTFLATVSLKH